MWLETLKKGDNVGITGFIDGVESLIDIVQVMEIKEEKFILVNSERKVKVFCKEDGRLNPDGEEELVQVNDETIEKYKFFLAHRRLNNSISALENIQHDFLKFDYKTLNMFADIIYNVVNWCKKEQ